MKTAIAISPMMRNVLSVATIPPAAVTASQMARIAPRIIPIIRPMSPVCARGLWQARAAPTARGGEFAGVTANPGEMAARGHARLGDDICSSRHYTKRGLSQQNFRRRVSCWPCRADPAQLAGHRLAGHGCWQSGGVEPVAGVPAAGRGGRAGQRGRYGIDGGFAGLAVSGVTGAGLAGTVAWAVRHRRPAVAVLAGAGGAVVAGSAASYLYSTGPGKRAIWAQLLDELGLRGDEQVLDVGCGRGAVLMLAARRPLQANIRLRTVTAWEPRRAASSRRYGRSSAPLR